MNKIKIIQIFLFKQKTEKYLTFKTKFLKQYLFFNNNISRETRRMEQKENLFSGSCVSQHFEGY